MPVPLPRSASAMSTLVAIPTLPSYLCDRTPLVDDPRKAYSNSPAPLLNEYGECSGVGVYGMTPSHFKYKRQLESQPDAPSPAAHTYLSALAAAMLTSSFPSPIVSPHGMLVVYGYSPMEGEAEALITVDAEMRFGGELDPSDPMVPKPESEPDLRLRLVLGRTALKTTVRESTLKVDDNPEVSGHKSSVFRLRVCAQVPPYEDVRFPEHLAVPMSLQVVLPHAEVLETVTFGTFTYWESRPPYAQSFSPSNNSPRNKRGREDDELHNYARPSPSARNNREREAVSTSGLSLIRTSIVPHSNVDGGAMTCPAALEWVVTEGNPHPNDIDQNWKPSEISMGRRLVRFHRMQKGAKLLVSCEAIDQEMYDEEDIVISCVRRVDKRNFWFTSVDVIYLLERLVGDPFSVEEKNRIRRNLEGFKPTTVSKHKPGFEDFFQQIMDFPPPKPRNIEKDVKAFPWPVLSQALEKIISKYSVCTTGSAPTTDSTSTPSPDSAPARSMSELDRVRREFHNGDVPTFAQQFDIGDPHSQFSTPPLLHLDETPVYFETANPHHFPQNILAFPGPVESDAVNMWHRRNAIGNTADGYSPELQAHSIGNVALPVIPDIPFTSAYVSNPRHVTLGELSVESQDYAFQQQPLQKQESYAHVTPLSSSPALLTAQAAAHMGPGSRSSSAGSLDLRYPPSYNGSPVGGGSSNYQNGLVGTASPNGMGYTEYGPSYEGL